MDEDSRIAAVEDVPADGSFLFTVREGFDTSDCPHWRDVRLDKGSGATVRGDELVCEKHGATFERDSGNCTFGPCEGAVLETVDVEVADGDVYLTDDRYEFENRGPSGDHDRSSGSRIGFSGQ